MLEFIYNGAAEVKQENLAAFLSFGEALNVKGLIGTERVQVG